MTAAVSVPELVRTTLLFDPEVKAASPGGVVVGPVGTAALKKDVIALAPVGMPKNERDLPLVRALILVRCLSTSVQKAEALAGLVKVKLHELRRKVVVQQGSGNEYLVHFFTVSGGPSLATGPIDDSWEVNLTVDALVGTEPVS